MSPCADHLPPLAVVPDSDFAGVTVVVAAVAIVYAFSSDVDDRLESRLALSRTLRSLSRGKIKANDGILTAMKERIKRLQEAVEEDANEAVTFNRRNLDVLRLDVGQAEADVVARFEVVHGPQALLFVGEAQAGFEAIRQC